MALQHRYVGVVDGRLIRKQMKNIVKLPLLADAIVVLGGDQWT